MGLHTNNFYPVSVAMYSPNYWDNQNGIGNKHYFFILKGCKNDTKPNGFFNEFVRADLVQKYKRFIASLGSKMSVEPSDEQLSGLGFCSTRGNSIICSLEGSFTRVVKVVF